MKAIMIKKADGNVEITTTDSRVWLSKSLNFWYDGPNCHVIPKKGRRYVGKGRNGSDKVYEVYRIKD